MEELEEVCTKDFFRIKPFHLEQIERFNIKLEIFNKDLFVEDVTKFI